MQYARYKREITGDWMCFPYSMLRSQWPSVLVLSQNGMTFTKTPFLRFSTWSGWRFSWKSGREDLWNSLTGAENEMCWTGLQVETRPIALVAHGQDWQIFRLTERQTERQTDKQTNRQKDRQTDRQIHKSISTTADIGNKTFKGIKRYTI